MIIESLTISNFRNYFGENTLNLSPTEDKNVILIGGMNGAGKTTLTDAVRLCLYGPKVNGKVFSDSKYQEYISINHCRKNRNNRGRYFIAMDLTLNDEYPPLRVTVKREFIPNVEGNFTEHLSITRNGNDIEIIDENYWDYYIERLIPPEVSRYFFFDGETVREAIASDSARTYLNAAIDDLAGVSSLTVLKNDLLEVRKRIASSSAKTASLKKIGEKRGRISEIEAKNAELQSKIDGFVENRMVLGGERDKLDTELKRLIGVKESKSNEIRDNINLAKQQLEQQNASVYEFCFNRLPFRIANHALVSTINRAMKEHDSRLAVYSKELLNRAIAEIKNDEGNAILDAQGLAKKELNVALDLISARIQMVNALDGPAILDLTYPRVKKMENAIVTDNESSLFIQLFNDREMTTLKIKDLESELKKFDDVSMTQLTDAIDEINSKIDSYREQIGQLQNIISYNNSNLQKLEEDISAEERSSIIGIRDKEAIRVIDSTSAAIEVRAEMAREKSRSLLTLSVNEIYSLLKNNSDMVKRVEVSSDCSVNLLAYEEEVVRISGISEGEKGILMYSLIFGLHALTKSKLPLIIDSPLGRMDSIHVDNLIQEFYPSVGQQVIILSHDREITKDGLNKMEPILAHTYTIRKDEVPKIVKGYFEGKKWRTN
jgi:DNA sulfur modification protein DndD